MNNRLLHSSEWISIAPSDEDLYRRYFQASEDAFSYENNWAFICQETRVMGIRYLHNELLLTATIKHRNSPFIFLLPPLFLAPPCEVAVTAERIVEIATQLKHSTNKRIVLRKLPADLFCAVIQTGKCLHLPPETFQCPSDVPEDITPQVIVSTQSTVACEGARFVKLRNQLKYFKQKYRPRVVTLSPSVVPDVQSLIAKWSQDYRERTSLRTHSSPVSIPSVDNTAYTIFAAIFADRIDNQQYFSKVVYADDVPVGFTFAGRTSSETAALYSSISLTAYRGASDYLMMQILETVLGLGIKWLNLGGAETMGLFNFKTKFAVTALRPSYDAEILTDSDGSMQKPNDNRDVSESLCK
jgi:hypothetical protein